MKKRKLLGSNNIKERRDTFMEGTEVELHGHEDIYAVDTDGVISTLVEKYVNGEFVSKRKSEKDPYKLPLQFIAEDEKWEEMGE